MKGQRGGEGRIYTPRTEASGETNPAGTSILDFQPEHTNTLDHFTHVGVTVKETPPSLTGVLLKRNTY